MLTRADVERITENVLRGLSIEVKTADFTNTNSRKILLKYNGDVISEDWFDVSDSPEYDR